MSRSIRHLKKSETMKMCITKYNNQLKKKQLQLHDSEKRYKIFSLIVYTLYTDYST